MIDEGAFGRVYLAEAFGIVPYRYKTQVAVKTLKGNQPILIALKEPANTVSII